MIVNPASDGIEGMFLGEDGNLYRVQGLNEEGGLQGPGHLFLGDDGALYRAESAVPANVGSTETPAKGADTSNATALNGYLLGEDGSLYEVTE